MRLGALEAGGTKMVLGVFDETLTQQSYAALPTLIPEQTIPAVLEF